MDSVNTRFRRSRTGDLATIAVFGPFDFNDPGVEVLARQILAEGQKDIVLDFSKVTYLTSPGISSIIKVLKRVQTVNGALCLLGASADMLELLTLANIIKYLKIMS